MPTSRHSSNGPILGLHAPRCTRSSTHSCCFGRSVGSQKLPMVLGQVLPHPFQQPGGRLAGPGLAGPEARLAWGATVRRVGMLAPGDGGPEEAVRAE